MKPLRLLWMSVGLCLVLSLAASAEIRIQAPGEPVPIDTPIGLSVTGPLDLRVIVLVPDQSAMVEQGLFHDGTPLIVFRASSPGLYTVVAIGPDRQIGWAELQVGDGPSPPPNPPQPGPLLTMLIYEQDPATSHLTLQQRAILTSRPIREYLATHSQMIDDQPAFRMLDRNADVAHLAPALRKEFDAGVSSGETPWLIIDNGSQRFEGPPPADAEATLDLLKQYGGE